MVACGGTQMKIFGLSGKELVEAKFEESESLYSCDSSHSENKFLVGGKAGGLTYLGSNKMT